MFKSTPAVCRYCNFTDNLFCLSLFPSFSSLFLYPSFPSSLSFPFSPSPSLFITCLSISFFLYLSLSPSLPLLPSLPLPAKALYLSFVLQKYLIAQVRNKNKPPKVLSPLSLSLSPSPSLPLSQSIVLPFIVVGIVNNVISAALHGVLLYWADLGIT